MEIRARSTFDFVVERNDHDIRRTQPKGMNALSRANMTQIHKTSHVSMMLLQMQ